MGEQFIRPVVVSHDEMERIEKIFGSAPRKVGPPERFDMLQGKAKALALEILKHCPESHERAEAFTSLELVVYWANAAITRATNN